MLLLALDTATPAVTVALHDGVSPVARSTEFDGRRHGELLAPAVRRVLAAAGARRTDLTAVAVGVGPGPFTGLRVGLVTALVLGESLGIPVHGVCTLDVLAAQSGLGAGPDGAAEEFVVATDARRREVYWARYAGTRRVAGPAVGSPAGVGWTGPAVGAGALAYPEHFPGARAPEYPAAEVLAGLVVAGYPPLPPRPLYLRRPDAVPLGERPQARP